MYKPSHLRKVVHYLPLFQTPWMNSKRQLNPSYLDLKAKGLLLFLHQDHCFPERKNQNGMYSVNMSKKRLLLRDSLSKVPFWTVLSQSVTLTDGQCLQEHGWWKTQRKRIFNRMILLFWRICLCGVMGNVWKKNINIKKTLGVTSEQLIFKLCFQCAFGFILLYSQFSITTASGHEWLSHRCILNWRWLLLG